MPFRPFSQRERPDPAFEEPESAIPAYLHGPLVQWVIEQLTYVDETGFQRQRVVHPDTIRDLQLDLGVNLHSFDHVHAFNELTRRLHTEESFLPDVLDWCVHHGDWTMIPSLNELLARGRAGYEVVQGADGSFLARRGVGPVAEAMTGIGSHSHRAHAHLQLAWQKLKGREEDASGAYREAVRAVEVAAKPVIAPNDGLFTLGKGISVMRADPSKWIIDLEAGSPEQIADMMALIWRGQFDRHGTDDETVPLTVSRDQAESAFMVALALVNLFVSGTVRQR